MIVDPYASPAAIDAAIKAAAQRAYTQDPSLTISERIRIEHFNRFLSRVFSDGPRSAWVLKGGTGMLARIPSTRATRDLDLWRTVESVDDAVADLERLASVDLGDHFTFVLSARTATLTDDTQPYAAGCRLTFEGYIGAARRDRIQVDLVVGAIATAPIETAQPRSALDLPRLVSYPYRLYPVVDQVADKACATMSRYGGRPSSRQKDLVDLVVLAVTQEIDGSSLQVALRTETARRGIQPIDSFRVPSDWGAGYAKLARPVPHCAAYADVAAATTVVASLLDPALGGNAAGKTWRLSTGWA